MPEYKEYFDEDDLKRIFDENKSTDEQLDELAKGYLDVLKSKPERYYVINPEQSRKFDELVDFFKRIAEEQEGVEIVMIKDKPVGLDGCGDITVEFEHLSFCGDDEMSDFLRMVSYASAIGITALTTGKVSLDLTVPDVFIEQED